MRRPLQIVAAGLFAGALVSGAHAQSQAAMQHGSPDHGNMSQQGTQGYGNMGSGGMQRGNMDPGSHVHGKTSPAGQPGDPSRVSRTVEVRALDTMRFEPAKLEVRSGETVRIVVTNAGKIAHELTIGDRKSQLEHEQMMQKMPGMKHDDPGSVTLAPGETKSIVWQFGEPGTVEFGCHVPGHYSAGMVSAVQVTDSPADPLPRGGG